MAVTLVLCWSRGFIQAGGGGGGFLHKVSIDTSDKDPEFKHPFPLVSFSFPRAGDRETNNRAFFKASESYYFFSIPPPDKEKNSDLR